MYKCILRVVQSSMLYELCYTLSMVYTSLRWYCVTCCLWCILHLGGTVLKLGTQRHHSKLLKGIDTLEDVGCFGLTELGYGMLSFSVTSNQLI